MIAESRKAIAAFLLAFLGPLGVLLAATDEPLDWRKAAAAFVAGVIAGLGTYLVPNATPPADGGPFVHPEV